MTKSHLSNVYIIVALLLLAGGVDSQTLGLRAPSAKHQQIDTDTVRVIFPEGQEAKAQRVTNIIHTMARRFPIQGNDKLKKISIILQDHTDISNGYVGLGPWRSEFYLSPPQNSFELGSLPWHELLAIHEFRHVQQRSAGRRGLSKIVSILLGQEAYSGMLNLSWPDWYTEGDAVVAETVLSPQGRGRIPAFTNGYRAKLLAGDAWNYQKARNGSFDELVPSHYPLGFLLQNYGREQFGQVVWDSIVLESAGYNGLIYPFSSAIEKRTGANSVAFYHEAMDYYRDIWADTKTSMSKADDITDEDSRYRNYTYPVFTDSGELYCVRSGFDQIPAIYVHGESGFEKVVSLGFAQEERISYGGRKLAWSELRLHPRWEREDHSVIMVYDIARRSKKKITAQSSYFSPDLAHDGERIVALFDNDQQEFALHILNSETGEIIEALPNPGNVYYSYPTWSADGSGVVAAIRNAQGQMALMIQDVANGERTFLTDFTHRPIGRPSVHGEWVYYSQSHGVAEHVFRVHVRTGETEQITDGPVSHYQPAIHPGTGDLIYSAFTLQGNKLHELESQQIRSLAQRESGITVRPIVEAGEFNVLAESPDRQFDTKKYPLLTAPVNIHSWNLYEEDPVYGLELLSENVLSSITWRNGFEYNINDDSYGPFSELAFGLWYPEILVGYSGRHREATVDNTTFKWFQHAINAGLRVPFQGYAGPYSQVGAISSRANRLSTNGDLDIKFDFLSHRAVFINRRRRAAQHPMTRFGQAIDVRLSHAVEDSTEARQFQVNTDLALPSLLPNHVVWLQFDYRRELLDNDFRFSDGFQYSRGYHRVGSDKSFRVGVNYQAPLVYPDFGIAGIVYFKRLRTNLFYDFTRLTVEAGSVDLRSTGIELIFDLEIFNVEPVEVGLRWSHLLDEDPLQPGLKYKFGFFTPFQRL